MLNIDEAIKHFELIAESLKQNAETEYYPIVEDKEKADCLECAKEYEQLAELLTQLRDIKAAYKTGQVFELVAVCMNIWGGTE